MVIGAGVVGAACALAAVEAGLAVTVVDRGSIAGGTTGAGEGNILVSDKEPGAELELAMASNGLWRELASRLDHDVELETKGGLVVTSAAEELAALHALAAQQASAGVRIEPVDADQLPTYEPYLRRGLPGGVFYPQDLQVQPMLAAAAMLHAAHWLGAQVRTGTEVTAILRRSDGAVCGVDCAGVKLAAGCVINAAGTWAGSVAALAGAQIPVRPRRGFILVTAPAPTLVLHKVYNAGYVTDVASAAASLQSSAVVEGTRSGTILIGATREIVGFERDLSLLALQRLAAQAVELFPVLAKIDVLRAYQGFRPYSPDHLPIIGADPIVAGLFHACGHEGAGIGLAPVTARLVVDAILGRPPVVDPTPFTPGRFISEEQADKPAGEQRTTDQRSWT